MFQTINMSANQRVEFTETFDYLRVLDCSGLGTVSLEFYLQGRKLDEANNIGQGYAENWSEPCDRVALVNGATAQTVQFVTRRGAAVEYDRAASNVNTTSTSTASVTQAPRTVTNASAQLIAANGARKAVLIQNKSATGTVWLMFNGSAATQAAGVRLLPGETYTQDQRTATLLINAIGDIASNTDVVTVEFN